MSSDILPSSLPEDVPASISPGDYWHRLHNWLQIRGWTKRFSFSKWQGGPHNAPKWHVIFTCSFHSPPRLFDSYPSPVDGEECSRGEGSKLIDAKNNAARISFQPILQQEKLRLLNEQREREFDETS